MTNVRDFGAMGDGMTDDTAAIEHAMKDGGDGLLEFPRGDYRITRTISFDMSKTGRLAIHGSGGTAKLRMHGAGPVFEFVGHHGGTADPTSFKPDVWQLERMPMIDQIEIEGAHPEADGVRFVGVMQPTLSGVLIRRVRHAVHITQRCRNVLISQCHIYHNTGIGVWLDRVNLHQTNIVGNHISYCRLGGIRIENSEIRNLQITGNDIEYNNYRAFNMPEAADVPTAEIFIDCSQSGTVREGTISSNTLQATYSPNGANIRIIGGPSEQSHHVGMWCISGNLIGSQATNVHLTLTRGVTFEGNYVYSGHHRNLLAEDCRNLVIGANCFGHNPDYKEKELCTGIRLVHCKNCTLTGLQIQDAQAGEHTVTDVVPIQRLGLVELIRCRQMTLTGLQILEGSPFGLYVEDCSETMLTGCTLLDTREHKQTQASIKWTGEGHGNAISHCRANRGVQVPAHVKQSDNLLDE
jgi:Pectate lyase superfamily protein